MGDALADELAKQGTALHYSVSMGLHGLAHARSVEQWLRRACDLVMMGAAQQARLQRRGWSSGSTWMRRERARRAKCIAQAGSICVKTLKRRSWRWKPPSWLKELQESSPCGRGGLSLSLGLLLQLSGSTWASSTR
eukprot:3749448-Amphidinium_carterae.3